MADIEKKQFMYKGKGIEELKALDVREFSKYLKSRARRSVLRQFQEIEDFVSRCKNKIERKKPIRTHKRALIIVPQMVGMIIGVHNGKEFLPVRITEIMLGHRLGEFALTRGKIQHGSPGVGSTKGTKSKAKK
ncbi:MAG: ribosomal protein S19 family protein [Nanoarchaeota archaeon]|nr:ribosomal protein S19 family protein [Nanoarchaeota archaeon]